MIHVLRPYQRKGIDQIRESYRAGSNAVLYVLPTGGGKTVMFSYITESAMRHGKRVLILVHRRELLKQASDSLTANGVDHGYIAPGFPMDGRKVQVASVQTVVRRLHKLHTPDLVILDEGHHVAARTWEKIVSEFRNARYLGVTATPCRLDGRGLGRQQGGLYDSMVVGPSMAELIQGGWLSPYELYAPDIGIDMSGVHTRMGDFKRDEVNQRVNKPAITGCALSHYRRYVDGKPAITFCVSVDHAHRVAETFRAAGYVSVPVDGTMKAADRDQAIRGLATGAIQVVTACDIISEGVDVPVVEAGILLRPTQSMGLFLQQIGRIFRPLPGKTAMLLDHAGNCWKHGLPDEDRQWQLNQPKVKRTKKDTEEKELSIRQCPKCYFVHKFGPECPHCGYIYTKKEREIEQRKGNLKKMSAEEFRKYRAQVKKRQEQGMAGGLEELLNVAKRRGYDERWAHHVWKARQRKAQKTKEKLQGSLL